MTHPTKLTYGRVRHVAGADVLHEAITIQTPFSFYCFPRAKDGIGLIYDSVQDSVDC